MIGLAGGWWVLGGWVVASVILGPIIGKMLKRAGGQYRPAERGNR